MANRLLTLEELFHPAVLDFWVPGPPVAKARARTVTRGRNGEVLPFARTYTPAKTERYEQYVRACALERWSPDSPPLDEPLRLEVLIILDVPTSWSAKRRAEAIAGGIRATKKPDLDNIVKSIKDALNRIIWRDDSLIIELEASKQYGWPAPGVRVVVSRTSGRKAP